MNLLIGCRLEPVRASGWLLCYQYTNTTIESVPAFKCSPDE